MSVRERIGKSAPRGRTVAAIAVIAAATAIVLAAVGLAGGAKVSAASFQDDMRKLWEDHVTWTRLVIVSVVADLPDTGPTLDRLMRNQEDIGNAVKPYYGDAAGSALTALLKDHIAIAGEILFAAKRGDNAAVQDAAARWYANADAIAEFLSGANPKHWPLSEMRSMMRTHLDLTLEEAVAQLTGDYARSISTYDQIHDQILGMADMLSMGIVHQFSDRFTGVGHVNG